NRKIHIARAQAVAPLLSMRRPIRNDHNFSRLRQCDQPRHVELLVQIETEQVGSVLVRHGYIQQVTQAPDSTPHDHLRKSRWLQPGSGETHHLTSHPSAVNALSSRAPRAL